MLYDILDVKGERLPDEQAGFGGVFGPIYLFVGGLFNLAGGEANGDLFKFFLNKLSTEGKNKAQGFYIQEKIPTSWEDKCYDIYLFGKEGKIPQASVELAHAVFLPSKIMKRLSPSSGTADFEGALQDLRNHFSRITLVGYSAGTAVIRQMEACAVTELENMGLTDAQIESVVQCGVAMDVGPAYSVPDTKKTLTHLVTVRRDDMMTGKMSELIGGYDFPERHTGKPLTAEKKNNTIILVPEIGDGTTRSVSRDAEDPSNSRVHFQDHEERHSIFMYINQKEIMELGEGKIMDVHPSLPTGKLVREFNAAAITASVEAVQNGVPRNGAALLTSFQRVNMSPRRLRRLEKIFRRDERYFKEHIAGGIKPEFVPTFWVAPAFVKELEAAARNNNKPAPSIPQPALKG